MKLLKFSLIAAIILAGTFTSCIEDEYNWDDMNTGGVLNIPPIPLGSYDKMTLIDLKVEKEQIPDPILGFRYEFQYKDTLKNLFESDVVKDFFHEYMERDFSIEGLLDVAIQQDIEGWGIGLSFDVLDDNNAIIQDIVINVEDLREIRKGEQKLSIVFPKENADKMDDARHLLVTIKFAVSIDEIYFTRDDYFQLSNLVIKTAGYFVDL